MKFTTNGARILTCAAGEKNSSPIHIEAAERIMQLMAAAGLPEG